MSTSIPGDFYPSLRIFFILGRFLGLLPISGVLSSHRTHSLYFSWKSIASFVCYIIICILGLSLSLELHNLFTSFSGKIVGWNASQLATEARDSIFYLVVILIYAFFQFRANRCIFLSLKWRTVISDLKCFIPRDHKLVNDAHLSGILIFGLGFLQSGLSGIKDFYGSSDKVGDSFYFSYVHPWIGLSFKFLASCVWIYADLFIILCSRALYYQFKLLVQETQGNKRNLDWTGIRRDHLILCGLVEDFENFLSPLIFICYSANTFFICLQLHEGLTPQEEIDVEKDSLINSLLSLFSFLHLLLRVLWVSLTAAKINEYAHAITNAIQDCPSSQYGNELERLERMLSSGGEIGLSGLGCFVVTRAFLIVLLSVIFTMEIVLLQSSSSFANSTTTTSITS